jgi:hypothetical protein
MMDIYVAELQFIYYIWRVAAVQVKELKNFYQFSEKFFSKIRDRV